MAVREFNNNSNAESTFDSHTPGISRVLHLSAGELLRCELADPTSTAGAEISKCIADGVIVPAEITVQLLRAQIETFADKAQFSIGPGDPVPMVLVDGFPRNMDNLECWNRVQPLQIQIHAYLGFIILYILRDQRKYFLHD